MNRAPRVLGMMSGTSADGVDAVLLELNGFDDNKPDIAELPLPRARVLAHQYTPYPEDLSAWVLATMQNQSDVSSLTQLSFALGEFYAQAALDLSKDADLIANHGQTVYHIPRIDHSRGWRVRGTLQIGDPAALALHTNKPVISDFRAADMVSGGQGAPLVPFADRIFFAERGVRRAVHNLGGISNLTYLPELESGGVIAFDTGPANCLIDEAMNKLGKRFDEGGQIAASGRLEPQLLELWKQDPYLELKPPKSTGREYWTLQKLPSVFELAPKDIVANMTALTAQTIADQYQRFVLPHGLDEILVAGGGTQNIALMQQMASNLPVPVLRLEDSKFAEYGFNSATREAAAFALLGYFAFRGWQNTLPATTGAARAVVAGRLTLP
ncbi:MAG: anhydro-N-acetylmuramic acid kinase [Deinococcales bacterium]